MRTREPLHAARLPEGFSPQDPHLVGVSGGRDSMALAHWLRGQGFSRLVICHLDHALRPESGEDAVFVQEQAAAWNCQCVTRRVDVARLAAERKQSLETAGRDARRDFFAEVAQERSCPRLILAHHADDQVETFLWRLLRGAGAAGLGAMAPLATRAVSGMELQIARPLLGVWRAEIDEHIRHHAIPFREDPSNAELHHTRNRIRHIALPALEEAAERDPRLALWRAAELLREEDALLGAAPELRALGETLEVSWLRSLPLALQRRVLHAWLHARKAEGIGFEEVEAVRRLLDGDIAKVNLPGGRCARRRSKVLFLDWQDAG